MEEIDFRHDMGDHRRCDPTACEGAVLVAEAASRGMDHARKAGKPYCVVNTATQPWEYRVFDRLQQAKPYRVAAGRKALGPAANIVYKSSVFVVQADGTVL